VAGSSGNDSVCAVLVTYHPDETSLRSSITAVLAQVQAVVVVDNGSPELGLDDLEVTVLAQESNVGLATAQNLGIRWARAHGHTHVLILDQDSLPAPDMVPILRDGWRELSESTRVAAVGPRFRDAREERDAPFVRVAFPMSEKIYCDGSAPYIRCDFLISSGVLIAMAVLDDVGDMDDGLFIDNVDLEWSFRARARGYELFGICAAQMAHSLGDDRRALPGRLQVVHGPTRLYYIMRNRVALYRRPHTPRVWTAQDIPRVFSKFLIFTILVGPRARNARYMLRGLADGVRGRTGPCPIGGTSPSGVHL
jgi:rhamnosyltransferase